MKDDGDLLPLTSNPGGVSPIPFKTSAGAGEAFLFRKGRYMFWALGAIILLSFWSMLAGTVTLRWSAGDLSSILPDDLDATTRHDDLDVLEMEEREKMVKHMWGLYIYGQGTRLASFWQQAFDAAYEDLTGDDQAARDDAISEIARMSVRMVDIEPPPASPKKSETEKEQEVGDDKPTEQLISSLPRETQ